MFVFCIMLYPHVHILLYIVQSKFNKENFCCVMFCTQLSNTVVQNSSLENPVFREAETVECTKHDIVFGCVGGKDLIVWTSSCVYMIVSLCNYKYSSIDSDSCLSKFYIFTFNQDT